MNNTSYGKLTAGLIAAWFVFAFSGGALHVFETDPGLPPLALGLAVLMPIIVFLFWFAISAGFRQFALSLDPRALTLAHSWRIAGFTFLALYAAGLLPGVFALPAGLGDIAIGATAHMAATKLGNFSRRRGFIFWQILGILDLVIAIMLGTTARLIDPHGVSTGVMNLLPMSLIPTFAVPLLVVLHLICIAQAKGWKETQGVLDGEQIPPRHMRGAGVAV